MHRYPPPPQPGRVSSQVRQPSATCWDHESARSGLTSHPSLRMNPRPLQDAACHLAVNHAVCNLCRVHSIPRGSWASSGPVLPAVSEGQEALPW